MRRDTIAKLPSRRVEKAIVLFALLGSVWAGQRLMERLNRPAASREVAAQVVVETPTIGAEYFAPVALEYLPKVDAWAGKQRQLGARIPPILRRKMTLNFTTAMDRTLLYPLTEIMDYDITPALPIAGQVIKLTDGPTCLRFVWTKFPMPDVTYTLEVAKKRDFIFFRTFGADTNTVRVQFERGSDFFWRVRAAVGRTQVVSPVSSFLVLEPELTEEQSHVREVTTRARDASAWLNDLSFCSNKSTAAVPSSGQTPAR
jgi:hypothetical protein